MRVDEAIAMRHSCRRYTSQSVSDADLAKLMAAALATPSAGSLRPLHILIVRDPSRIRALASAAAQAWIEKVGICFVIAADYDKLRVRYRRRAERYAILEAGHAAQNIALQAVELGLATVMVGAFKDRAVKEAIGITQSPLYIIPLGYEA